MKSPCFRGSVCFPIIGWNCATQFSSCLLKSNVCTLCDNQGFFKIIMDPCCDLGFWCQRYELFTHWFILFQTACQQKDASGDSQHVHVLKIACNILGCFAFRCLLYVYFVRLLICMLILSGCSSTEAWCWRGSGSTALTWTTLWQVSDWQERLMHGRFTPPLTYPHPQAWCWRGFVSLWFTEWYYNISSLREFHRNTM